MRKILSEIEKVKKSDTKKIIDQRMKEFRDMKKKTNRDWFCELCFCLMTANWKAKESIELQEQLSHEGFCAWPQKKLAGFLKKKGHRFWPQRAERISLARKHIEIKDIMIKEKDPREWLVKNIKGLGYKEASHFLRNVGYEDYAIIDRHIINTLIEKKLIEPPKTITKKRYLEIENILAGIAKKAGLNQAELDLYLWYLKTGKVLK